MYTRMQDPDTNSKILDSVRETVETYPFYVDNAAEQIRIISGRDEGIGLWVTANYVSGSLVNVSTAIRIRIVLGTDTPVVACIVWIAVYMYIIDWLL